MNEILENLNPAQREAVVNYTGPSLIVAGAGSGKTRVLTARIAYMIAQGIAPWNILALTFTNKAAAEMRARIETMIGGQRARYIQMGTFHSIFLRILRTEHASAGYPASFTIYDTTDSQNIVKGICKELGLADNDKYKPRAVFAKISRLKNDLVTPVVYENESAFTADDVKRGQTQFVEIYKRYVAQCRSNGAMDFDDLLVNMVFLLRDNPDILEKYRAQFRYILVDEYQDTNHVQYLIVKALGKEHQNVSVVGDDSQSIYSFRGARIENILNFRRDFPAAEVYKLEQNYRSTQTIVSAANGVIARNRSSRELKKECFSAGEEGEKIKLLSAYTDREEADMVAGEIRKLGRDGVEWSEMAVLYRANALSRGIEESLRRRDIPYKIYRGHSFFERKEIKDVLGYFRLTVNPADDEAFRRIVNYPARGIGAVTVEKIAIEAREKGVSMWEAAVGMGDKKIAAFTGLITDFAAAREGMPLYEFGREVAVRSGIVGSYRAERTPEAESALQNIDELLNTMVADDDGAQPQTLDEWLQNIALFTDMDAGGEEDPNRVTLMTVHSAKGLEFDHVFVIGLEEELFPSVRDGDQQELEEERRLFYVALTRARRRVYLSHTEMRFVHGQMNFRRPSRFVREIDERYLESGGGERGREASWADGGRQPHFSRAAGSREARSPEGIVYRGKLAKVGLGEGNLRGTPPLPTEQARAASGDLAVGARVRHAKFGAGTVEELEPAMGGDLRVVVAFDDRSAGRKTLLSKFARLEVLG